MSELSIEEKAKLNGVCHGDKTIPLTRAEMDYCFKRLRGDRLPSSEIAKRLGVKVGDVDRWIIAGYAMAGREGSQPPVGDQPLPQTISEKLGVKQHPAAEQREDAAPPAPVKLPADVRAPKPEDIKPGRLTVIPARPEVVVEDPLIAAALEVRRTATVCAEAEAAHHAAVERLQDEISAVRYPDAEQVFARELAATPAHEPATSKTIDFKAVRAWAQEQGIEVSATGRIKAEVIEAYRKAMAS